MRQTHLSSVVPSSHQESIEQDSIENEPPREAERHMPPPRREMQGGQAPAWRTPWAEVGLPEPGWWKAFAIDKNVRATRTPDRVLKERLAENTNSAAFLDTVSGPPHSPHLRDEAASTGGAGAANPVRSQIAELQSAVQSLTARPGQAHRNRSSEGKSSDGSSSKGPSLEERIRALQEAEARQDALQEARQDSSPVRPRPVEVAPPRPKPAVEAPAAEQPKSVTAHEPDEAVAATELGKATASFGRMTCTYSVEILSLCASYAALPEEPYGPAAEEACAGAEPGPVAEPDEVLSAEITPAEVEPAEFAAAENAPETEPVEAVEIPEEDTAPAVAEASAEEAEAPVTTAQADVDLGLLWLYADAAPTAAPVADPVSPEPAVAETSLSAAESRADESPAMAVEPASRPADPAPLIRSLGATAGTYELPNTVCLAQPPETQGQILTEDILEEAAGRLEKIIRDFGVKGEIIHVHPGPVVTLYEFEPAPGTKSARVIALSDDIARSMSAVSARVAVIPGRNAIGIELPNEVRETVYLREQLESADFKASKQKLPLCLGKTIGGEPVIADLARMPHLLVAGTTGSGKSVAINTMILSLLFRFRPEECRLIMVDPKMLELSVYDGIPHLLTPVVTDPKKAIIALRWAVREMEDRYKKMSKLGVRNIDGFNARVSEAKARGEEITRTVQTGFDRETGQAVYEDEVMDLEPLPYIVVIVDEMADLMMVAGKEIEGAIQRLAQMARAAGIHVILATQRPSVDVITGTIKANFPTRISFQVTSKIDSRTILGEMGAEQLLGQGDMLYMAGGGRITRVHGPFCSDEEVEKVVAHLKRQAKPVYLEAVTADEEEDDESEDTPVFDEGDMGLGSADVYDQAVSIVLRHKKASTSYIQRRLQIGYNRAASIMERMEKEGVVGPANHAGKREILLGHDIHDED